MSMTETRPSAARDGATGAKSEAKNGLTITSVEAIKLKLPYKKPVSFASQTESTSHYVILRIVLSDGTEGIAESVCRPGHTGEDAVTVAYQLETFFKPLLIGADPLGHLALLAKIAKVRECRAAKMLIDVVLWDLRGKVFGQPVWRLLGGTDPKPVPLTWIAHGNTREAMVDEARRMAEERGYRGIKLKTWKRSMEDIEMVAEVRKLLPEAVLYIDGNGIYTESETRTILINVKDYNVAFMEEPCKFTDISRQAAMAAFLPVALLGDQCCDSLTQVHSHIRANSVGAVSVKLRRTGITESLKIIALCEAAGLPVVIGTDSEGRIGSLVRMHLRSAIPSLAPWPTETHFFDKLGDDTFAGDFNFADGAITPSDAPGFGAALNRRKIERYAF